MQVADLGHLWQAWDCHKHWVELLEEEMFLQGDHEHKIGLQVSPMADRTKPGISSTQVPQLKDCVLAQDVVFKATCPL